MSKERQRPPSLLRQMNGDDEIMSFGRWREAEGAEVVSFGLITPANYDKIEAAWFPESGKDQLERAIRRFAKENPGVYNHQTCTWEDVVETMEAAATEYNEKGRKNPMRRMLRRGENVVSYVHLLEAIPTEKGIGIIKGGLAILLHAISKRAQSCRKMFASFDGVPELIARAHHIHDQFPNNENIAKAIDELYHTLFGSISALIDILLRKPDKSVGPLSRFNRSLFHDRNAEVEDILTKVSDAKARMEDRFRDASENRDKVTAEATVQTLDIVIELQEDTFPIIEQLSDLLYETKNECSEMKRQLVQSQQERQRLAVENRERQQLGLGIDMINAVYIIIEEQIRSNRYQNQLGLEAGLFQLLVMPAPPGGGTSSLNPRHQLGPRPPHTVTEGALLKAIGGEQEHLASTKDQTSIMGQFHQFSDRALAQASYLLELEVFQQWLTSNASDMLVVDAHCQHHSVGKTSPMSVLCALVAQNLGELFPQARMGPSSPGGALVLFFACGYHAAQHPPSLDGPRGMILSFISGALLNWPSRRPPDVGFLDDQPALWDGCQAHDVAALCDTFQSLVAQLPPETRFYCIIDDVSQFETEVQGWGEDLETVMNCLEECVAFIGSQPGSPGFFKVLLTSADKSLTLASRVPEDRHVDLRAGLHLPARQGMRSFAANTQQRLSGSFDQEPV